MQDSKATIAVISFVRPEATGNGDNSMVFKQHHAIIAVILAGKNCMTTIPHDEHPHREQRQNENLFASFKENFDPWSPATIQLPLPLSAWSVLLLCPLNLVLLFKI